MIERIRKQLKGNGIFLAAAFFPSLTFAKEQTVFVAEVEKAPRGLAVDYRCTVTTPQNYQISSHADAPLEWLLPTYSAVKKGQVVAKQFSFYLTQDIEQTQQLLDSAEALVDYNQLEHKRLLTLKKQKPLISASSLAKVALDLKQARLRVKQLQSELKTLNFRLQRTEHRAPVDGYIASLEAQPGDHLNEGSLIASLIPSNEKEVTCEIPAQVLKEMGGPSGLALANYYYSETVALGFKRSGQISHRSKQTLKIVLDVPSEVSGQLLVGERIKVAVSQSGIKVVKVPVDAINVEQNQYYVWRVTGGDKVEKANIDILYSEPSYLLVNSPLQPGDQVVTLGKSKLKEQQAIVIAASDANVEEATL